jgi:hypothetical protein
MKIVISVWLLSVHNTAVGKVAKKVIGEPWFPGLTLKTVLT